MLCSHAEQDISRRDKCNRTLHDLATDDCKDLLENLGKGLPVSSSHTDVLTAAPGQPSSYTWFLDP